MKVSNCCAAPITDTDDIRCSSCYQQCEEVELAGVNRTLQSGQCICHLGSVCNSACDKGICHDGCTQPKEKILPILGWTVFKSHQGTRLRFPDGTEDWPSPRERQIIQAFLLFEYQQKASNQ